jgi:hypothetical protein
MKKFMMICAAVGLLLAGTTQSYAQPALDAGWSYDQIDAPFINSNNGTMVYDLAGSAVFSVTDNFVPGDVYYLYDMGNLILTTTFDGAQASLTPIGDPNGDFGWTSADYSHGSVLLAAGHHELTLQGDGVGGTPAGLYERIDSPSVPEPSSLALAGLGAIGAAFAAYRRRRVAA